VIGLLLPLWLNLDGGGGPAPVEHGDAPGVRFMGVRAPVRVIGVPGSARSVAVPAESRVIIVQLDDEAPMETRKQDPGDTLDYTRDFGEFLEEDEMLDDVQWSISPDDASIELGSGSYAATVSADGKRATVWIVGGTAGETYTVTATATTDNVPARIKETSFRLEVEQQ
jgi:hypothetical protein